MKFLAASAALLSAANAVQVWTSHSNYEACASISHGPEICQRKFYTVTEHPLVEGWEAEQACNDLGAYPWCPESQEEIEEVYANMALLEYSNSQGHLDIGKWLADGVSKFTGIQINAHYNAATKEISNHVCTNELRSEDGVINYGWNTDYLDSTIFFAGDNRHDAEAKCVAVGEGLTFKLGHLRCEDPRPEHERRDNMFRKRAVCVTTRDMSHDPHHAEMDMEAPEIIKREFKAIVDAIATAIMIWMLFMIVIFTGCCFCCCCCCCCKPCKSGDSEPVVTETTTTTNAAAPAPMPPAPAPAPYMPPAPAPAPYNPYGQPAYQQPMQQPMGMGGINLNISNNNTNTNR